MKRILHHVGDNAIAYLALFVALGGTSYAAYSLPANSVGQAQIRNHAIDPVKFDTRSINGSVRAWAIVGSAGRVIAGGGKPKVGPPSTPGSYEIRWGTKFPRNCATTAAIDGDHSPVTEHVGIPGNASVPATAGYAVVDSIGGTKSVTFVNTFSQQGALTSLGFDVAVIC